MKLPFSAQQFFDVLGDYNLGLWPAQLVWTVAAIGGVCTTFIQRDWDRALGWLLAALWTWMAVAYHLAFFTRINPAAWWFGAVFLLGAGAFAWHAFAGTLRFGRPASASHGVGLALIAYALVGYPLLAIALGQAYPRLPTFGLPCPTTIFTLGCLLLADRPVPAVLFVVPIAWSLVGSVAAVTLGVVEDYGLVVAAVVSLVLTLGRSRAKVWHGADPSRQMFRARSCRSR